MEEFEKLLSELDIKLESVDNKREAVENEAKDLYSKDIDSFTEEESKRFDVLVGFRNLCDYSYTHVINPKYSLLPMFIDAKKNIETISRKDLNKSVRTKTINALIDLLLKIKEQDYMELSERDIRALYDDRDNEEDFEANLKRVDLAVESHYRALIKEINDELDMLDGEFEKNNVAAYISVWPNETSKSAKSKKGLIAKIVAGVLGVAVLTVALHNCGKNKDKEDTNTKAVPTVAPTAVPTVKPTATPTVKPTATPTVKPTATPTVEPTATPTVEPTATPTVEPTAEPTPEPTAVPTPTVNPMADREADMLRRASLVANTNFFEGAYTSDIVGILNAIHDREMWATENAGYAQLFNTTFNRIYEHYIMGTLNQDDLNKLDALKNLAKDNSDLDRFLEAYCDLLRDVLTNKKDAHTRMRRFIEIFGTSLNGFTNEPTLLTDDDVFNENAQVNDFFDWWFAYDSIIKPTHPLLYPKELYDIDGALIEQIMYHTYGATEAGRRAYIEALGLGDYEDFIYDYIRLLETQMLMESALTNHPMFCQISHITEGPSLGLGEEGGNN